MIPYKLLVAPAKDGTPDPEADRIVHEGVMPPFDPAPDVALWGSRVFMRDRELEKNDPTRRYVETFAWYAVS